MPHPLYFEVRSITNNNGYNPSGPMNLIMGRQSPIVDIEHNQKFDDTLLKRLAKILEELSNLED